MAVASDSSRRGVRVAASSRRALLTFLMTPDIPDPLADLLRRPKWMKDGACLETPGVNFFPTRGESTREAKAVCARCLVREECLAYGLEHDGRGGGGIWGGTSERERRKLRRSVA